MFHYITNIQQHTLTREHTKIPPVRPGNKNKCQEELKKNSLFILLLLLMFLHRFLFTVPSLAELFIATGWRCYILRSVRQQQRSFNVLVCTSRRHRSFMTSCLTNLSLTLYHFRVNNRPTSCYIGVSTESSSPHLFTSFHIEK